MEPTRTRTSRCYLPTAITIGQDELGCGRKTPRLARRIAGVVSLATVLMGVVSVAGAQPNATSTFQDHRGLGPYASVPAWATQGKPVHFIPSRNDFPPSAISNNAPTNKKTKNCGGCIVPLHFSKNEEQPGEVQLEPEVYLIFWGPEWSKGLGAERDSAYGLLYASMATTLSEFTNESYTGILWQYHNAQGVHISTHIKLSYRVVDKDVPPAGVEQKEIEKEAQKVISENHWTPNHNAQFVVFPQESTHYKEPWLEENGCGWNTVLNYGSGAKEAMLDWIPWAGDSQFKGGCNNGSGFFAETEAAVTHEFAEAATDPEFGGRWAWEGGEGGGENEQVGDLCEFWPAEPLSISGTWGQELWSNNEYNKNHNEGCTMKDPPEPASPAPSATTEPATGVTQTEATLHGVVNPNETETYYHFEYGTTTSYGSSTSSTDAGWGYNTVPESATITGFKPNTTYHYRIVASSPDGTSYGNDQAFTTPAPPEVNTDPATEIKENQATLNGYVNPHLADTHYYFQYGTTAGYGSTVPAPPGNDVGSGNEAIPVSVSDTSLQAGVVYHFRIVATNEWGTSYGPDRVVRTAAWSAAVAEPGDEAIGVCFGGTSTPTGCVRAPGAEASGTSPSVARLSDGSAAEAVVGAGGHLDECHVTSGGSSKCWETSIVVASETNPGIAEITNGNAIMAVNTTSGLQFCEATSTGPVNCTNAGWPPHAGTSPSVAPLSNGNAAVSIVDTGGKLVQCKVTYEGGSNCYETSIAVASGTNPGIAEITNGNAIMAVNTTSGLQFCEATSTGPVNCTNAGWPPHAGTSPSVAPLSNGNAAVSIVDTGGKLVQCKVTYEGGSNCYETSIAVASGTNPGIAEITNGNAIMAVNTTSGLQFCEATSTGPVNCTNAGWPPHAGTSPSVAPLSNGNAAVSIVDTGGKLVQCKVTYEGGSNCYETSIAVASGTNPGIAEITNGNAIMAVNTTSGLSECQATNTGPVDCTVGSSVATGTSPSMAQLSTGNAAVGFVNSSKHLTECSVTYFGGSNCYETSIAVASGTNPGIAEITNGNAIMAVNTTSGLQFCEATSTGPVNCTNADWPPHAGTSPSVAPLSNGNAAVSIVDTGGKLVQCKVTYEGGSNCYETSIAVASGTNPGIAEITNGNAIMAVNTTSGLQFCEATSTGPVNCTNAGWPPHAGTSPSVAPLSNGNAAVGIVDTGGEFVQCKVTYEGGSNCYETSIAVASGTNPGIAEITNGNAIMAVNTTGGLEFCEATSTGPVNCTNAGWPPHAGTSPSVAPLSNGNAAVGIVDTGGKFVQCKVTYEGGSNCYETSTAVAPETNPSMAWLPGGQEE